MCAEKEVARGEIFRETPLPAREEETSARSRDADMSITFVVLVPARSRDFRPSATFKPASKSNHFALTGRYQLKLDVTGAIRRLIVVYDAQKNLEAHPLDSGSKSLAHSAISQQNLID